MAHNDECEQAYDNGRATLDGDITFAVVLVSVTWVGFVIALQVAGVCALEVFGIFWSCRPA